MKSKPNILNLLFAWGTALAMFVTLPASIARAELGGLEKPSCSSGCFLLQPVSTVPVVSSVVRSGLNPTDADTVKFEVTFSEPVTGVDIADFAPVIQGVGFVLVTEVHGSGSTYVVSVYTGYGNGTLGLDIVDNDTIRNGSGETLGGVGVYNGNFSGDEVYSIAKAVQ